mmetsp:Transcript_13741/g.35265  ORF Transcript_13741/g.35265 Transcript_13741/m.35265 type:complete len:109 (-) Transcript_13741:1037-1363(-)
MLIRTSCSVQYNAVIKLIAEAGRGSVTVTQGGATVLHRLPALHDLYHTLSHLLVFRAPQSSGLYLEGFLPKPHILSSTPFFRHFAMPSLVQLDADSIIGATTSTTLLR